MEWKVTSNPPELAHSTLEQLNMRGITWEEFLDETLDQLEPLSEMTQHHLQLTAPYKGDVSQLIALVQGRQREQEDMSASSTENSANPIAPLWRKLKALLPFHEKKKTPTGLNQGTVFLATGDTTNHSATVLGGEVFGIWDIPLSWVLLYCHGSNSLILCLAQTSFDSREEDPTVDAFFSP